MCSSFYRLTEFFNSQCISHFAAPFIVFRTETSITENCELFKNRKSTLRTCEYIASAMDRFEHVSFKSQIDSSLYHFYHGPFQKCIFSNRYRFDQRSLHPGIGSISCLFYNGSFRPGVVSKIDRFDNGSLRQGIISTRVRFYNGSLRPGIASSMYRRPWVASDMDRFEHKSFQ